MFFLISGAAASGKTTVARAFAGRRVDLRSHDADEIPASTGEERWYGLEQWVQQALAAQAQGADFLLTSHSPLGELLTCPSAPQLESIVASLLDCDDLERLARIQARGIDPRWPPNQHTFNWASWHRLHAANPQWEPQVIRQFCPFPQHLARWSAWTDYDPRWHVERIGTTGLSVGDTIRAVETWLDLCCTRPSPLAAATCWWDVTTGSAMPNDTSED